VTSTITMLQARNVYVYVCIVHRKEEEYLSLTHSW
jgi:hypothetical protein